MKINKHSYIYLFKTFNIFLLFFLLSCTVTVDKINNNMIIKTLNSFSQEYKELSTLIVVKTDTQELFFLKKGLIQDKYSVSTSVYGTGSNVNSFKTPLGKHVIDEKIGEDMPLGAILKGRNWTGAIANIIKEPIDTDFDVITSRILWLKGLEKGFNSGPGVDSKSRYIYIHGTAEEGLIGKPASNGCIRMYNNEVITLFDKVDTNTQVWIF
tara:strand:- start:2265 stop:2897 length:633 start_codon:yes stop_codon:yes gene_type:complete